MKEMLKLHLKHSGIPNVTGVDVVSLYEEDKVQQTKLKEYVNFIKNTYPKLEIPLARNLIDKKSKSATNKKEKIK